MQGKRHRRQFPVALWRHPHPWIRVFLRWFFFRVARKIPVRESRSSIEVGFWPYEFSGVVLDLSPTSVIPDHPQPVFLGPMVAGLVFVLPELAFWGIAQLFLSKLYRVLFI